MDGPPRHRRLRGPFPVLPRIRHLFDPQHGWFRRLERRLSHEISTNLYPRIPGIGIPYGLLLERTLVVSEAEIAIAGLPPSFDGMRILLITDIHAGAFVTPRTLGRTFERLLTLRPDLVLLGGDLTMSRIADIVPHLPAFASLEAPLGVFAVLGNHDHYTGQPARVSELLEESRVRVLHNAAVPLERDGRRIFLAGIDDLYAGRPDLAAALAGTGHGAPFKIDGARGSAEDSRPPVILLSHNPDVFFEASRRGVALVLSGHTHGGQVRIPGLPVLVRQSRYRLDEGRYTTGGSQLVVSRGLGASGLPVRIACPPEAVLITLR